MVSSKQLTVDIERYQLLADQFDGVSYELEQAKKRIAELETELNARLQDSHGMSNEVITAKKRFADILSMDKDAELRSFTNKLYRFKNAASGLNFETIDEYIAAKTALYDLVKELIEKAGDVK
ncbi:MAG: hypothetical protein WAT41_15865 [Flavobacteriales bacterium]